MSLFSTLIPSLNRTPANSGTDTTTAPEQTVKPAYKVTETTDAFAVTVHLPGVAKDGLELTAEDGQIRIVGRRAWKQPEGWTSLYRESADTTFELVLTHEHTFDADKIQAELRDGVLQVTLPKAEAAKPRKIAIS